MVCEMTIWNATANTKRVVLCDEENTTRIVEDDHAAKGLGQYADVNGNTVEVDWTRDRLVKFVRRRDEA